MHHNIIVVLVVLCFFVVLECLVLFGYYNNVFKYLYFFFVRATRREDIFCELVFGVCVKYIFACLLCLCVVILYIL